MLTLHIRKLGGVEFEWLATYGHERIASGREVALADCLRSAADAVFPSVQRLDCRLVYEGRVAGPVSISRLFESDELADHLKELAGER